MTIDNFKKSVNKTILRRGEEYFEEERVQELEETSNGYWTAIVEGNEDYEVEVQLEGNTIKETYCDCPHDAIICKHIVATLFAISEEMEQAPTLPVKNNNITVRELLSKVSHKELETFVSSFAAKNKAFRSELELYFIGKINDDNLEEKYTKLINQAIQLKYRYDEIVNYSEYIRALKKYLQIAKNNLKDEHYKESFIICNLLYQKSLELIEETDIDLLDDKYPSFFDVIEGILKIIGSLAENEKVPTEAKLSIFDFLSVKVKEGDDIFETIDFIKDEQLACYETICIALHKEEAYIAFLDRQKDNYATSLKIDFLKKIGRVNEAENLINKNLSIPSLRYQRLEEYIAQKDYVGAKELLKDGIKQAEKDKYPGLVSNWEKELLKIAVIEKDTENIRLYAHKFAAESYRDDEYYKLWKGTYTPEEWHSVIQQEIEKREKAVNKDRKKYLYPQDEVLLFMYINEKMFDKLWEQIKHCEYSTIMNYLWYVQPLYNDEILDRLCNWMKEECQKLTKRDEYAEFVRKVKNILDKFPKNSSIVMRTLREIKEIVQRRPAFLDELRVLIN